MARSSSLVPKPRRVGAATAGPPISRHEKRSRPSSSSQAIFTRPEATASAPCFRRCPASVKRPEILAAPLPAFYEAGAGNPTANQSSGAPLSPLRRTVKVSGRRSDPKASVQVSGQSGRGPVK